MRQSIKLFTRSLAAIDVPAADHITPDKTDTYLDDSRPARIALERGIDLVAEAHHLDLHAVEQAGGADLQAGEHPRHPRQRSYARDARHSGR